MQKKAMSAPLGKRKSITELRREQVKRHQTSQERGAHESPNSQGTPDSAENGQPAAPPCSLGDTRCADSYPPVKPGEGLRFHPLRDSKDKDQQRISPLEASQDQNPATSNWRKRTALSSTIAAKVPTGRSQEDTSAGGNGALRFCIFRDVKEISCQGQPKSVEPGINMAEALKKLAHRKALGPFNPNMGPPLTSNVHSSGTNGMLLLADSGGAPQTNPLAKVPSLAPYAPTSNEQSSAWISFKGNFAPLDLSLKTSARFSSLDTLHWCHRPSSNAQCKGLRKFTDSLGIASWEEETVEMVGTLDKNGEKEKRDANFWQALHSWVHPHTSLPPSVLSAIADASARGGEPESSFLSKRNRMWEDAFRSLYYMFRYQKCTLFYFCAPQFVAMFVGGAVGGRSLEASSAYITRSTRGLRHLLCEQDISFSMPFCISVAPTTNLEDLRDLTEFEKSHPGQTRLVDERAAVDGSPQSLVCVEGISNVHRLYDFLLNHRSLLHYTADADAPVLYAPVPFQHASLTIPEVTCKEMQRVDAPAKRASQELLRDKQTLASKPSSEPALCKTYSMELKGNLLAPWVTKKLCGVLQKSQQAGFETRFLTEPLTEGLNIAQGSVHEPNHPSSSHHFTKDLTNSKQAGNVAGKTQTRAEASDSLSMYGFAEPSGLGHAVIKELKYNGGLYTAQLTNLQL